MSILICTQVFHIHGLFYYNNEICIIQLNHYPKSMLTALDYITVFGHTVGAGLFFNYISPQLCTSGFGKGLCCSTKL